MRHLSSLRLRLVAIALGAVGVGLTIAALGFFLVLRASLLNDATSVAQERAEARASLLAVEGGSLAGDAATNEKLDADVAWVVANDGSIASGPKRSDDLMAAVRAVGTGAPPATVERLRLAAAPLMINGQRRGTVVATTAMRPYDDTMHAAQVGAAILISFVLISLATAAWWLLRSALDPVARMTRDAAEWSDADLDRRFDLGPPRDELTGLAATLDDLLGRLAASVRHERHLTSEISHELRTPLARITAQAELGRTSSDPEAAAAFDAVLRSAGQMNETLTALLAAGRATGGSDTCRVADAVARVVDDAAPDAAARGVRLQVPQSAGPRLWVATDSQVLERALAPLVANAVDHSRALVSLSVTAVDGHVAIEVADDGPGVAAADLASVFTPGVRGEGAPRGGSGLGLPLARRLARAAGGDVVAWPGPGGRFRLTLPSASPSRRSGSDQV